MKVRQTGCRHCDQDIENFSPYRKGEWRDRGNNTTCPTPEGDKGLKHAPYLERRWRTNMKRIIDRVVLTVGAVVIAVFGLGD